MDFAMVLHWYTPCTSSPVVHGQERKNIRQTPRCEMKKDGSIGSLSVVYR